jgi:hypothetical protein
VINAAQVNIATSATLAGRGKIRWMSALGRNEGVGNALFLVSRAGRRKECCVFCPVFGAKTHHHFSDAMIST